MNSRLRELVNEIESVRATIYTHVAPLPPHRFGERPDPSQWSVGEILQHLYLTEKGVSTLLEKQVKRAQTRGIGPDTGNESLIHCLDQFAIDRVSTKLMAPPQAQPDKDIDKEPVITQLKESRAAFLETVARAADYDLSEITFPHPMVGRLNMYQWILFVGKHEKRHFLQLQEITP